MPTKAISELLDRAMARAASRDILDAIDRVLGELVNNGTHVLRRCAVEAGREKDVDLPALTLYRHQLELTDGAHELLRLSCVQAAVPVVRASFEAMLGLKYLLEADGEYEQRSRAWLVAHLDREERRHRLYDPETPQGVQFYKAWSRGPQRELSLPGAALAESRQRRGTIAELVGRSGFADVWAEYEAERKRRKRPPSWFALWGGPGNLRELAQKFDCEVQYDVLYREWSSSVHAGELYAYVEPVGSGHADFKALRGAGRIKTASFFACYFLLHTTRLMIGHFRTGESLAAWYIREVREPWIALWGRDPDESAGGPAQEGEPR